jgi:hypothetical protein
VPVETARVATVDPSPTVTADPTRRRRLPMRRIVLFALVVVAIVVIAIASWQWLQSTRA